MNVTFDSLRYRMEKLAWNSINKFNETQASETSTLKHAGRINEIRILIKRMRIFASRIIPRSGIYAHVYFFLDF